MAFGVFTPTPPDDAPRFDTANGPHIPLTEEALARKRVAMGKLSEIEKVAAKDGSTLVYYNTVWQPLDVRLNTETQTRVSEIQRVCQARNIKAYVVFHPGLEDIRMQNMAVLSVIHGKTLIPGIQETHYKNAMTDLLQGTVLKQNLMLFEEVH